MKGRSRNRVVQGLLERPHWIAGAIWLIGFVVLRAVGTTAVLQGGAVALSAWLLFTDAETRRLLAVRVIPLFAGILAGVAMIAATYVVYPLLVHRWPPLAAEVAKLEGLLFDHRNRLAVLAIVLPTSACEEILFRGRSLERVGQSPAPSVALSALLYSAVHVSSGSAVLVAVAFACGLVWGFLRVGMGSLWCSIACHVSWDIAITVVHPL
jgi:uncharacterized protein